MLDAGPNGDIRYATSASATQADTAADLGCFCIPKISATEAAAHRIARDQWLIRDSPFSGPICRPSGTLTHVLAPARRSDPGDSEGGRWRTVERCTSGLPWLWSV